jgi:hypothetical protein
MISRVRYGAAFSLRPFRISDQSMAITRIFFDLSQNRPHLLVSAHNLEGIAMYISLPSLMAYLFATRKS